MNLTKNDSQIFYIFILMLIVFILMTENTLGLYALPFGLLLIRNKGKSYLQNEDTKWLIVVMLQGVIGKDTDVVIKSIIFLQV